METTFYARLAAAIEPLQRIGTRNNLIWLVDENVQPPTSARLKGAGFTYVDIKTFGSGAKDPEIYAAAATLGIPIFTHDLDFLDFKFLPLDNAAGAVVLPTSRNGPNVPKKKTILSDALHDLTQRMSRWTPTNFAGRVFHYDHDHLLKTYAITEANPHAPTVVNTTRYPDNQKRHG